MRQPEMEPASPAWDEHKPPVDWPDLNGGRAGKSFAGICLWIAGGCLFSAASLTVLGVAGDDLADTIAFFMWCGSGSLTVLGLFAATLTMLIQMRRNQPAFRLAAWSLLGFGLSLAGHVGMALWTLSRVNFC